MDKKPLPSVIHNGLWSFVSHKMVPPSLQG
jgi:hypothetical protein